MIFGLLFLFFYNPALKREGVKIEQQFSFKKSVNDLE